MLSEKVICPITGKQIDKAQALKVADVQIPLKNFLFRKFPNVKQEDFISEESYDNILNDYVEAILNTDKGELSRLEVEVLSNIKESEIISSNLQKTFREHVTWGEKMADRLASFGGSWYFVCFFIFFLLLWIVFNLFTATDFKFDPYPFILLNLILSSLAALQAPVIMMSQNRAEAKDRLRSEHDYQINLKAELEIRSLHQKMDHLLMKQMQHLIEIQQLQIDLMEKIRKQFQR